MHSDNIILFHTAEELRREAEVCCSQRRTKPVIQNHQASIRQVPLCSQLTQRQGRKASHNSSGIRHMLDWTFQRSTEQRTTRGRCWYSRKRDRSRHQCRTPYQRRNCNGHKKKLKNNKAPGQDNMNAELFKIGPETAAGILELQLLFQNNLDRSLRTRGLDQRGYYQDYKEGHLQRLQQLERYHPSVNPQQDLLQSDHKQNIYGSWYNIEKGTGRIQKRQELYRMDFYSAKHHRTECGMAKATPREFHWLWESLW